MRHSLIAAACGLCSLMASATTPAYLNESLPIEQRVADAIKRMTLSEKIAMIHAQGKFCAPGVARLGIPDLWMSDGPHGVREEIKWNDWDHAGHTNDSITAFPALTALAATWNPSLAHDYGNALAEEAVYREKDVMLGPGVNIYRTPLNGRNFEYMGEDPYLASTMVVPYIQGMQKNGVAACVKHYALNNQELWRGHINVELSDRALHEIYLPAFKAAVTKGDVWSIMGAYNQIRGQHACHNELMLNKILKQDWGFKGVVITDWGGAHDTRQAALYGLDLEMGTYTNGLSTDKSLGYNTYYLADPYRKALLDGSLPMEGLDDKVGRLLRLNFLTAMNRNKGFGSLCTQAHYDVAENIGNEGIVLLKNAPLKKGEAPLLPIAPNRYGSILVVGDNAVRHLNEGGGSSELKAKDVVSPLDGLREIYGDKITYTQGYAAGRPFYGHAEVVKQSVADSLRRVAAELSAKADLVILVGGLNKNAFQDCEGVDRLSYDLPFGQPELIEALAAANPNLVVVLLSGNGVAMPWESKVPALVEGWYLGSMGGRSIANVLSGKINPSGKLPFSIPFKLEDCGAHAFGKMSYPGDSINQHYMEDVLVGYRWHDTKKIAPRYAFGHGLSYTTFDYGKPELSARELSRGDSLTVAVTVTNTGTRAGMETVQLYIGDDKASVVRPTKELKAFEKVNLSPGRSTVVKLTVAPEDLCFYDDVLGQWRSEAGRFTVYVGASSADIRGKASFTLK